MTLIDSTLYKCDTCDGRFTTKGLGQHWRRTGHFPELSMKQVEILKGIVMGDGTIKGKNNVKVVLYNTNRNFLNWFDSQFGNMTTGIYLQKTGNYQKNKNKEYGFSSSESEYKDIYAVSTRQNPDLNFFWNWSVDNKKRFPKTLELTPIISKLWYVCDGNLTQSMVRISSVNEMSRSEFLESLFREKGFKCNMSGQNLTLSVESSQKFLDWIGKPIPGFEYKWGVDA